MTKRTTSRVVVVISVLSFYTGQGVSSINGAVNIESKSSTISRVNSEGIIAEENHDPFPSSCVGHSRLGPFGTSHSKFREDHNR